MSTEEPIEGPGDHPPKVAALEGFELTVVGNVPLGERASLKDEDSTARR